MSATDTGITIQRRRHRMMTHLNAMTAATGSLISFATLSWAMVAASFVACEDKSENDDQAGASAVKAALIWCRRPR